MTPKLDRRRFLRSTLLASSAGAAASFEEKALLARPEEPRDRPAAPGDPLPAGRIGKLTVTRLICGGNLISSFAHSRDLIYVSRLLKEYFTDAKAVETLAACERQGINTAILRVDAQILRILQAYRKQGGKMHWIAQARLPEKDPMAEIKAAVDNGAAGVYLHGGVADNLVQKGQVGQIAKTVEAIRAAGVVAGVAGHMLDVTVACEKEQLPVDFYMKTLNSKSYWSAGFMPRNDSVWEETPEQTIAFMRGIRVPWIAFKVLGAGAIHPREGFRYAFQNGADFICVGMFDFQVVEDVILARGALDGLERARPWMA